MTRHLHTECEWEASDTLGYKQPVGDTPLTQLVRITKVCETCGAIVLDLTAHTRWHQT